MTRRRPWLRWLALELAVATIGALMALVRVSLFTGFGGLVDDPTPRPVSAVIAAKLEPLERAAFIKTFTILAGLFAFFHLARYLASPVKLQDVGPLGGASSELRRRLLLLLLVATFIFDWVEAWLTTLFEPAAVPNSLEPLLAWIVVGGALWALVLARFGRPAWPAHSAVGAVIAVVFAIALSFLRKSIEITLFATIPVLVWLLLDKGLADDGPYKKPISAEVHR